MRTQTASAEQPPSPDPGRRTVVGTGRSSLNSVHTIYGVHTYCSLSLNKEAQHKDSSQKTRGQQTMRVDRNAAWPCSVGDRWQAGN